MENETDIDDKPYKRPDVKIHHDDDIVKDEGEFEESLFDPPLDL